MKKRFVVVLVFLGAILSTLPIVAQTGTHRILFALTSADEGDRRLTINNVRNLISGMAPETVDIEIVAYGPGISFLTKAGPDANDILKLESAHVHLVACGNAMRKEHLEASDLVAGTEIVPAGIVEVVRKLEQGWTYIKAGR